MQNDVSGIPYVLTNQEGGSFPSRVWLTKMAAIEGDHANLQVSSFLSTRLYYYMLYYYKSIY